MTCANCSAPALYTYKVSVTKGIDYCGKHLPRFLEARRKAGLLTLTEQHGVALDEAMTKLSKSKKKKTEPVVEEPVVEEEPVSVEVSEEPSEISE
jgi:hypothetical protein